MSFNKSFYLKNKENIEKVAEKLKDFYKEIEKINLLAMDSKIKEDQLEEISDGAALQQENCSTYSIYRNSYDPRLGETLVVYAPMPKIQDEDIIKTNLKKYFGDCVFRKSKSLCNKTSYRVYDAYNLDVVFEQDLDRYTRLNIIFNGNPLKDAVKFSKFWAKRPEGVIY